MQRFPFLSGKSYAGCMKTKCIVRTATGDARRPLRTLIVDDSALLLAVLRRFLDGESLVRVVDTAFDGVEAVRKAEILTPDLVLMDLNMPGMDGLDATVLLRRRLPDTRIIIMTLDDTLRAKNSARAHGAHGFVAKCRLVNDLMTEVKRVARC
jgi:DNA-binding NarL/FixJ family response regulator